MWYERLAAYFTGHLPLYFRHSLFLLLFSAILSWGLAIPIHVDHMSTIGNNGARARLAWCGYWFLMLIPMVQIPIASNLGGAYL